MKTTNSIKRILITGPESSGKTTLAKSLAKTHKEPWVPEYAREYLTANGPEYKLTDLIKIADGQFSSEDNLARLARKFLFCDTGPLVLKIWAEYRFGTCPDFIQKAWESRPYYQIFLCMPSLDWEPDPLRENPNNREELYELYVKALMEAGKRFTVIKH